MPTINCEFGTKNPLSTEFFGFNFSQQLAVGETITSAVWSIACDTDSEFVQDTNPATMFPVSPPPSTFDVTSTIVSTALKGGLPGAQYILSCTAITSGGQTLTGQGTLFVQSC
jgi:hypothetical protein